MSLLTEVDLILTYTNVFLLVATAKLVKKISPTNTNAPRTAGAIVLFHSGNLQGGYDSSSLSTGKLIHRRRWTELPIPTEVITMIDEMVEKECHHSHDLDISLQGYTYVHKHK